MPTEIGAVFLGLSLSLVNFFIFIVMTAVALRKKTTIASGWMAGGFIVRITIVMVVYLILVNSRVWEPLIYYVTAGFIPSLTVLLVPEIYLTVKMEGRAKK